MRVVSLNLDHGDATVVRRALRLALNTCQCAGYPNRTLCSDCNALAATLVELDRLVGRSAPGRAPLLTLVAADGRHCAANSAPHTNERGGETEFRVLAGDGGARGTR